MFKQPLSLIVNPVEPAQNVFNSQTQVRKSLPTLEHLFLFYPQNFVKKKKKETKKRGKEKVILHKRMSFFSSKSNQQKQSIKSIKINWKLSIGYELPIYLEDSRMTILFLSSLRLSHLNYHPKTSLSESNYK